MNIVTSISTLYNIQSWFYCSRRLHSVTLIEARHRRLPVQTLPPKEACAANLSLITTLIP